MTAEDPLTNNWISALADLDRRARPPAEIVPRYRREIDESKGVLVDIGGVNQSIKELLVQIAALERQNAIILERTETLANQIQQLQVTPEEIEQATEDILNTQQDIIDGISRITTDNEQLQASIQMVLSDQNFLETQIQAALMANPQIIREIVVREVEVQTTTTDTIINNTIETIIAADADIQSAVDGAIDDLLDATDTRIDDLVDTAVAEEVAGLQGTDEATIRRIAGETVDDLIGDLRTEFTGNITSLDTELTNSISSLDTELTTEINRLNNSLRTTVRSETTSLNATINNQVAGLNRSFVTEANRISDRITSIGNLNIAGIESGINAINARLQTINAGIRQVCHVGNSPPPNPQVGQMWYDTSENPRQLKVRGSNFWGRV